MGAESRLGSTPRREPAATSSSLSGQLPQPPRPIWRLLLGSLALGGVTLLLPAAPTYDPWAWITWGREVTQLDLTTTHGPSWKPLPVLFTTPFALVGDVAPTLWLWVAHSGGLLSVAMAFRVARRLAGPGPTGLVAGVVGAALLLTSTKYFLDAALGSSEGILAALFLWGFERHLDGRHDHVLYIGFGCALLRPEVWPFLGLYGAWLWYREPRLRLRVALVGVAIPTLWFLPELWGSGDPFRAAGRANRPKPDSAAFAERPSAEVIVRFAGFMVVSIVLAAAAVGGALRRRREHRAVLALAAIGTVWLLLVAGMTEAGFSGNHRYLIVSTVSFAVLGGVGAGRLYLIGAEVVRARLAAGARGLAAVCVAAVVVAAVAVAPPLVRAQIDSAERTFDRVGFRASQWRTLDDAVAAAGGVDALLACRAVYTGPLEIPMVAHALGLHTGEVGYLRRVAPGVTLRSRTEPSGPIEGKPDGPGFRPVAASRRWRIETAPPQGRVGLRCPRPG